MAADSVSRIEVGGDGPEGGNSAYLVADRAVVDPGPPTERAWQELQAGLERAGVAPASLEYVLVTHWHADHAGLAPRLAETADATLAMGAADAALVADYARERERRLERDAETIRRCGVPTAAVDSVIDGDAVSPMPDETPVERLADGDRVAGLEAVATPGHTLGHTAFASDDVLLVGDAVLPTVTPNVGGSDTRTLRGSGRESGAASTIEAGDHDPLGAFRSTLERLADRPERLLPGHGAAIEQGRIEELLNHHRERSQRVLGALENDESTAAAKTPWEVARELFGDLEGIHVKFGAGEAAAHLQALERGGLVERVADDPIRYDVVR
ncbi:MBL fold metallo-hydrolase [Haloterrigena sp. H1]|uniref:MBL fold metallo-hydrolase n=1 Tax=Haloterrigena sp. H1 TaxID=2552943 RepID=UPI00110E5277|nr:MBL fold metallo-hydrolase [Haloterrigena sp. H1]TMT86307.1 MBL fold metallo-hydrolase [Haloterrigena sp. H1]